MPAVKENSTTETYFAIKAFVDTEQWHGVPFYLEHGKALSENVTEITIRFRSMKNHVNKNNEDKTYPNSICFTISPQQKITVRFWVRKKGLLYELEPKNFIFERNNHSDDKSVFADAYEGVLYDALRGDQTLFVSTREQEAAWKYITTILHLWKEQIPLTYAQGSTGPNSTLQEVVHGLFDF